jgi:cardiolipin-specific phospholipase
MIFWSSSLQTAAKLERLRQAEAKLLDMAKSFGTRSAEEYEIRVFDTFIPRSAVPFKPLSSSDGSATASATANSWSTYDCTRTSTSISTNISTSSSTSTPTKDANEDCTQDEEELVIHGIQVTAQTTAHDKENTTETPLVLLHGYMNASAYFYRNLVGLTDYYQSIFSLDMLGWGLSSRPSFQNLKDDSLETAEDFFVESLEVWRSKNNVDKMVLAGHSMGGYISVAYCERYPQHVERLLLLSPVGVPDENDPSYLERKKRIQSSWSGSAFLGVFQTFFEITTVGSVLRTLPESQAYQFAQNYVIRRLPEISDPEEQKAVAEYLFYNNVLPGSGEYAIHKMLDSNILAKRPLQHRIQKLRVKDVYFMYGTTDWMEISAALTAQRLCEANTNKNTNDVGGPSSSPPNVSVFMVRDAGHLLMLQNWHMTNAVLIHAGGGKVPEGQLPIVMTPGAEDMPDSSLRESVRTRLQPGSPPQVAI